MPEDSFKTILFAFILLSLFGMLILTSVVSVADNYSKDTSQVVGGSLSLDKFNESITNVENDAKAMEERFEKQSIWSAIAGVVVEGIFGIAKDMIVMILLPFDIVTDIMLDVFNVPVFVTSVLLGLIIIAMMFGIWRLIKIGD